MDAGVRLDKWLWAARLYKTRSLAAGQAQSGRVSVNGAPAKASREVRIGDRISLWRPDGPLVLDVRGLSARRGPAPVAQALYEETPESLAERRRRQEAARLAPDPAAALKAGRPTKRDRRELVEWDRWSARVDE
jgi:ribosome-associated heat shock protein Hsp15